MTEPNEQDLPEPDDTPLAPDEQEDTEQEEAEQTPAEPEPESEPEADPEPEPVASPVTPEQHDARVVALVKSYGTYTRRFETLFEADSADYFMCPLCAGETPGFINRGAIGRFPEQQADLVKQILGLARPVDYPPSSQHDRCTECQGLGKVSTGSAVPGKETIMCGVCSGNGFTGPPPQVPTAATNGSEGVTGPTVFNEPTVPADFDAWNQPRLLPSGHDNPNYGRMPNHWIPVEPWGDTRGLTAQDAVRGAG